MQRWIGFGLLAVLIMATNACRSANISAASNSKALQPCEIALSEHNGEEKIDKEIRQAQQRIRANQNHQQSLPMIEKLGWSYVEKARASFDPGYYKLAEQCAICLEAKQAVLKKSSEPAQSGEVTQIAWNSQSAQSTKSSALLLRGHVLHSLHRFAEAEVLARELITMRGLAFDYGLLGDVLMEQGKLDEAIPAYQKMMELKPGPQAYSRAAHVRWLKGDTEGARALMRLSAQSAGQGDAGASAWAWSKLAIYELQSGNLKQADLACNQALEMQQNYAPALLARGRILLAENKFDEAVPTLQNAARLNPLPEYQWTLAEALHAARRDDDAQKVESELAARGSNDDPRTFAIYLATRGEQLSTALKLAEEEMKNRRDVFTLDALAWAQSASGSTPKDWDDAWKTMQSALATGTQDARLFFHAALIAAKSGQPARAREYSKQALALQMVLLPSEKEQLRRLKI